MPSIVKGSIEWIDAVNRLTSIRCLRGPARGLQWKDTQNDNLLQHYKERHKELEPVCAFVQRGPVNHHRQF